MKNFAWFEAIALLLIVIISVVSGTTPGPHRPDLRTVQQDSSRASAH